MKDQVFIVPTLFILLFGLAPAAHAQGIQPATISGVSRLDVCSDSVKAGLLAIWQDTFGGKSPQDSMQWERAFTLDDPQGKPTFYMGSRFETYITRWQGIKSVYHTHPDAASPEPSPADAKAAQHYNVFIYALSRNELWRVGPSGLNVFVSRYGSHQVLIPSGSGGSWMVSKWEPEVCWKPRKR